MVSSLIAFVPRVANVAITLADTEYTFVIPSGVKRLSFQCRTSAAIRFAWATGLVATPVAPYLTLKSGSTFIETMHIIKPTTLYLGAATNPLVIEIDYWF